MSSAINDKKTHMADWHYRETIADILDPQEDLQALQAQVLTIITRHALSVVLEDLVARTNRSAERTTLEALRLEVSRGRKDPVNADF